MPVAKRTDRRKTLIALEEGLMEPGSVNEVIEKAFSDRKLYEPVAKVSKGHSEYFAIEDFLACDWSDPSRADFRTASRGLVLLHPETFAFLFGRYMRMCLAAPVAMMGNELTNMLFLFLSDDLSNHLTTDLLGTFDRFTMDEKQATLKWFSAMDGTSFAENVDFYKVAEERLRQLFSGQEPG